MEQMSDQLIWWGNNEVGLQDTGCVLDWFLHLFYMQEYRRPAKGIIKKLQFP